MMLTKMGITVKNARIATFVTVFCVLVGYCATATAQQITDFTWNGGAYGTPNSPSYSWWGIGTLTTATGDATRYWDNWTFTRTANNGTFTVPRFSQGQTVTFSATGVTNMPISTTTVDPNSYAISGIRLDRRTVVNDMYMNGGGWKFTGNGVIGNRLNLKGSDFFLTNTKFSFAHGTQWTSGTITFTNDNTFDNYYWNPNTAAVANDWDPNQRITPTELGEINEEHNTIFVLNDLTIQRSDTIDGGNNYNLSNRFDVHEDKTLTLSTPWGRWVTVTGVNAFESRPDSAHHVNGGAFYLRNGADLARAVNGTGSMPGAWDFKFNYGYQGGAVYAQQNLSLYGNSRFSNNEAANRGGAVFMNGSQPLSIGNKLRLNTENGDIVFENNSSYGVDNKNTFAKLLNAGTTSTVAYRANQIGQYLLDGGTDTINIDGDWYNVNSDNVFIADGTSNPVKYHNLTSNWYALDTATGDYYYDGSGAADYRSTDGTGTSITTGWYNVNNQGHILGTLLGNSLTVAFVSGAGENKWYPYFYGNDQSYFYTFSGNTLVPAVRSSLTGTAQWYYTDNAGRILSNVNGTLVNYVTGASTVDGWYQANANGRFVNNQGYTVTTGWDFTANSGAGGVAWVRIDANSGRPINAAGQQLVRHSNGNYYRVNDAGQWINAGGTVIGDPTVNAGVPGTPVVVADSTMVIINVITATMQEATASTTTLTPQTVTSVTAPTAITKRDDAIHLAKNIDMVVDGTRRVFMEDNITTNTDPTALAAGGNSLTVNLEGAETQAFLQFGENTDSLLNPSGKTGGKVTVQEGTVRISDNSRFQTMGNGSATFTVAQDGVLAGGGVSGKSVSDMTTIPDAANYTAPIGSGTFGAADGFIISGTVSPDNYKFQIPNNLDGNATMDTPASRAIGYMNFWGSVEFDGAVLQIDTNQDQLNSITAFGTADGSLKNSDFIMVDQINGTVGSGYIYLNKDENGKSTVNVKTWTGSGRYVIASSNLDILDASNHDIKITNDNITDYFNEIVPEGVSVSQNQRRVAGISIDDNLLGVAGVSGIERDIVIQTADDGNVNLVWTGKTDDMTWNADIPGTLPNEGMVNWKRRNVTPVIDLSFREGDVVYFDVTNNLNPGTATHEVITSDNIAPPNQSLTVGGMVVEGGSYHFNGDQLIGRKVGSVGLNATGRLDIQLTDGNATLTDVILNLSTDFDKGTRLSGRTGGTTTVTLGVDDALGKYDTPFTNITNESGAVYVYDFANQTGTDVTVATSYLGDDRTLQNHFEVREGSNLTFDLTAVDGEGKLTSLTINDVNTEYSDLPNNQTHQGGAFYVGSNSTVKWNGNLNLINNIAQNGGAIYAARNLTIYGNTLFQENKARINGGAIYMDGSSGSTLTLDTNSNGDNGDIVFKNNQNAGISNSIFLNRNVTLKITGDHNVFFDDPIQSGMGNSTLSRNHFDMSGTGFVQFQGSNVLNVGTASSGGDIKINSGSFRLANDAAFNAASSQYSANFTVAPGAGLAGNGTITISNKNETANYGFVFGNGSTISPDSAVFSSDLTGAGNTKIEAVDAIGKLTLAESNVNLNGAILNIQIDGATNDFISVKKDNAHAGTTGNILLTGIDDTRNFVAVSTITAPTSNAYLIVQADGIFSSDTGNTVGELKKHISSSLDALVASPRGGSGQMVFRTTGSATNLADTATGANELWIINYTAGDNLRVYWTGKISNMWDEATTINWQNGPGGQDTDFYSDDYVVFDEDTVPVTNHDITLNAPPVRVVGMDVFSGHYTISGTGSINGVATGGTYTGPEPKGYLTVGGTNSAAELTLGIDTDFVNGTILGKNGRININYTDSMTTGALGIFDATGATKRGNVDVQDNGTIGGPTTLTAATIRNRFTVADGKELTFDIAAGKTLTNDGVNVTSIAGASDGGAVVLGNGSTINKTGTGNLVFSGNQAVNGNAVAVTGGTGKINAVAGDIVFTGNTVGNGAVYGAAGTTTELTGTTNGRIFFNGNDKIVTDGNGDLKVTGSVTVITNSGATIGGNATVDNTATLFIGKTNSGLANVAADTFTLASGATVSGSGTITANTITLRGTLDPDDSTYSYNTATGVNLANSPALADLHLVGNTHFDGSTIAVNLNSGSLTADKIIVTNGTVTVSGTNTVKLKDTQGINAGDYLFLDTTTDLTAFVNNFVPTRVSRSSVTVILDPSDNTNLLLHIVAGGAKELFWTGNTGSEMDKKWYAGDDTIENWIEDETDPNETRAGFQKNDTVNFTDGSYVATPKNPNEVTVHGNVEVTDMNILSGDHLFVKDTIKGVGDLTIEGNSKAQFDVTLNFSGLTIDNADVTLSRANTINATTLTGTTTVTLGNAQGLGSGAVSVGGNATLKTTADYSIDNAFVLIDNAFVLNNGDLTIDTTKELTLAKTTGALTGTGNFTIKNGNVKFLNTGSAINGNFTLNKGATLSSGNNVTISANNFALNGTVVVDNAAGQLKLAGGNVTFDGATLLVDLSNGTPINVTGGGASIVKTTNDKNIIDISSSLIWGNDYTIVATSGGITTTGGSTPTEADLANLFTVKQNGTELVSNSRESYSLELASSNNDLVLKLNPVTNEALYWEGSFSDTWKDGSENWLSAETNGTRTIFVNGDYVNFKKSLANKNDINVGGTYNTSGMKIIDGDYIFRNGTLTGSIGTIGGNATSGRLDIEGDGDVTFNVKTHFEEGITVSGNRNIVIGDNEALGSLNTNDLEGNVSIAGGKNVSVQTSTNGDRNINNRFAVGNGAELTLNAAGGNLTVNNTTGGYTVDLDSSAKLKVDGSYNVTFTAPIHGAGSNVFTKEGEGSVSLTGTNDLGTNSIATINAGNMILETDNDTLTVSSFELNGTAKLIGNGEVSAATIKLSGTIDNGNVVGEIGTLTLKGNTLFDGVTLVVDLQGDRTSDNLQVTGDVTFNTGNMVQLRSWEKGTYDIITAIGSMSDSISKDYWDIDYSQIGGPASSDRFNAEIAKSADGKVLQLVTTGTNAQLVWTGSKAPNVDWDDQGTKNWKNSNNGTEDFFMSGDAVLFNGEGQGKVDVVLPSNATIADMTISSGKYDFNGKLVGRTNGSTLNGVTGSLKILGGQSTFNNIVDFEGGIDVSGNKTAVTLENGGRLVSDKDIIFNSGTTLTLTPATGLIDSKGTVTLNGNVVVNRPNNTSTSIVNVISAGDPLDELRLASIFNTSAGLHEQYAFFHDSSTKMDLNYQKITPSDFADRKDLPHNEKEAAKGVTLAEGGNMDDLKDYLYELNTDAEVTAALDQLRGTEMAASALAMSLWEPWTKVYKQLLTRDDYPSPIHSVKGQAPKFKGRDVWIEGYYRYLDVNGDGNARKYYEKRGGMVMGLDTKVNHFSTLGISFGYGNPQLSTKFGKVEADDFTLALYSKTQIQSDVFLNAYMGLGFQSYDYERYENLNVFSTYKGDYNGNSAYVSLELYKPYKWNEAWTLFPLAALDYQRAWSSGFKEFGGPYAQTIHKGNVDRFVTRIGINSKLQYSDSVNFLTRLQYGFMVGGDTRAAIDSTFTGTTTKMHMTGVHLGRSQINLGIGGEWYLDQRKCLKFFGDYDLDFGTRHSAQTGQLGLVVAW